MRPKHSSSRQAAQCVLDRYARQFTDAGWQADQVLCEIVDGVFSHSAIAEVMAREAQDRDMDIVVVGRTPHGRLFQALLRSTGERLLLHLNTVTVWIVGTPDDQPEDGCESGDEAG
ncbi:MAG: universal stress protein [Planctomycetes bacterium]|nr:universal stress protein [Planctomycetota bacterium]